jgi:hypothetical protein
MSLEALLQKMGGSVFPTAQVTIGETVYTLKALSDAEERLVEASHDAEPLPPMITDPSRGSLAPKIANTEDPAYLLRKEKHFRDLVHLRAVASLVKGEGNSVTADAIKAAGTHIREWPSVDVNTLLQAYFKLQRADVKN